MKIAYVGPNKGAGLEMPNSKIVFQGKNSKYRSSKSQIAID